jgi:hypothetical protein
MKPQHLPPEPTKKPHSHLEFPWGTNPRILPWLSFPAHQKMNEICPKREKMRYVKYLPFLGVVEWTLMVVFSMP